MASRGPRTQRSEFKQRLKAIHPQLEAFFSLLAEPDSSLRLSEYSAAMLNEVARLLPFDQSYELIATQAASLYALSRELGIADTVNCGEFLWLLRKWYRKYNVPLGQTVTPLSAILRKQVSKTLIEYRTQLTRVTAPEERMHYEQLVHTLQMQMRELQSCDQLHSAAVLSRFPSAEEEKGLKDVFKFYATQHNVAGVSPTFQAITESNACMDLGSFLHFCTDFHLYQPKSPQIYSLRKPQIQQIYKTVTPVARKMQFQMFISALDLVANEYFNEKYTELHPGPCNAIFIPIPQKRILLYEMINIGDPKHYLKTCKSFQRAFASTIEPGARMFEDDLSLRYKPRDTSRAKERINRYKEEKLREKQEKEAMEKAKSLQQAKLALVKIKEKLEIEEGRRLGNLVKFEELPAMTSQDLLGEEKRVLEELVGD